MREIGFVGKLDVLSLC